MPDMAVSLIGEASRLPYPMYFDLNMRLGGVSVGRRISRWADYRERGVPMRLSHGLHEKISAADLH
jgi:hypothetical protein